MLSRSAHTPAAMSRRTQAQRRLRRTASHRLFCSTNGCTTFLVVDESGEHAVCPICGLQRNVRSQRPAPTASRTH